MAQNGPNLLPDSLATCYEHWSHWAGGSGGVDTTFYVGAGPGGCTRVYFRTSYDTYSVPGACLQLIAHRPAAPAQGSIRSTTFSTDRPLSRRIFSFFLLSIRSFEFLPSLSSSPSIFYHLLFCFTFTYRLVISSFRTHADTMAYSAKYKPRPFTDVFTSDTDANRRECTRKVPMKVLILGLGRTGTACMF